MKYQKLSLLWDIPRINEGSQQIITLAVYNTIT